MNTKKMGEMRNMRKIKGLILTSLIVLSLFAIICPVSLAQTEIGNHALTIVYEKAYIRDDHDNVGAGDWIFKILSGPETRTSSTIARNGPGWVTISTSHTRQIQSNTNFQIRAEEMDGENVDYWDSSTQNVQILDHRVNQWIEVNGDSLGDVSHYFKYRVSNLPPEANAISDRSVYVNEEVLFIGEGIDRDGDGIGYEWDFSFDGINFITESFDKNPTHIYPEPSSYVVAFRVKDPFGMESSIQTANVDVSLGLSSAVEALEDATLGLQEDLGEMDAWHDEWDSPVEALVGWWNDWQTPIEDVVSWKPVAQEQMLGLEIVTDDLQEDMGEMEAWHEEWDSPVETMNDWWLDRHVSLEEVVSWKPVAQELMLGLEGETGSLRNDLDIMQSRYEGWDDLMESLDGWWNDWGESIENIVSWMPDAQGQISELEARMISVENELGASKTELEGKIASLEDELMTTRTDLEGIIGSLEEDQTATRTELEGKIASLEDELMTTRTDLEDMIESLEEDQTTTRTELEDKIASLEEELDAVINENEEMSKYITIYTVVGKGKDELEMSFTIVELDYVKSLKKGKSEFSAASFEEYIETYWSEGKVKSVSYWVRGWTGELIGPQ